MAAAIYEHAGALGLFLFFVVSGGFLYLLLSGGSYFYFFVVRKERYHPAYVPDRAQLGRSFRWAAYSVAGNSLLMLPLQLLVIHGHSRIYYDVAAHGLPYLLVSLILLLVVTETMIYWVHMCGTFKDPTTLPERFFAAKGLAAPISRTGLEGRRGAEAGFAGEAS